MKVEELIKKYREEVLAKVPYRMNLVELLHANENAHTRILVKLLRYNHNDKDFEFAESFVRKFIPALGGIGVPEVWEQIEYIDALMGVSGEYAIIIENKINWAVDQDGQIARYLDAAERLLKVGPDRLYVIYLTDNGVKKPTDGSLTPMAKEKLGIDSCGNGRLVLMNYRDDIIPWLVEDVLPFCRHGDAQTITAIDQYIDYLKNRLEEKPEFEENEEKFFCSILKGAPLNQYQCLEDIKGSIRDDVNVDRSVDQAVERTSLIELIERKQNALLRGGYSLGGANAIPLMVSRIRDFAAGYKYYGPKKYQATTVIFSEVQGKDMSRIKFQISVCGDRRLNIGFFDNGETKIVLEKRFPQSVELFNEKFSGVYYKEEGGHNLWCDTDPFDKEDELSAFLRENVDPFMKQFMKDVVNN